MTKKDDMSSSFFCFFIKSAYYLQNDITIKKYMKKIIFFLLFTCGFFIIGNLNAYFNMTVSPIKYEIEAEQWDIVVKSATLYNYSNQTLHITTSTAEFTSDGSSGQPRIVNAQGENSISHWITLHTQDFDIQPNSQKTINFDIFIPDDATPGWHYGAVFFENQSTLDNQSSGVWVNVDYWVLLLVNVDGEIVKKANVDGVSVSGWASYTTQDIQQKPQKDICPLWDFSRTNFDGLCIDKITKKDSNDEEVDLSDLWDLLPKDQNDLNVKFEIPFENQWNTHIKPNGKIILKDENGNQIKWVWKEIILNENGAIIWEKIVDYLPINDIGGNVLPQTTRVFEWEWKWFPYKSYDLEWNQIIEYANPSEYYSQKNLEQNRILNFWERVLQRKNQKVVTAQIEVSYDDINGEEIEFNSAEDFTIEYVDTYIGVNKYIFSVWGVIVFIGSILYILAYFRKKKCKKCGKRIKRYLKACPYCGKKQKDKDWKKKKNKEA